MMKTSQVANSELCFCQSMKISGTRMFLLALVIVAVLNGRDQVEAFRFAFNGFTGLSDVYSVQQDLEVWAYNTDNQSLTLTPYNPMTTNVVGRFLYPTPVQMMEPGTTSVKNFSTTFIFQIFLQPSSATMVGGVGPGLAFIMVPDNVTVGAGLDYMGILTTTTESTAKNYASDNHTVAVEIDTHLNPEFNDPNDNHICIDVASLNSTEYNTFIPTIPLTTGNIARVQQVWIDHYIQTDGSSKIDIFHGEYPLSKPGTPLGSQTVGLDLQAVLKESMYLGFSSSVGLESSNVHSIFAWSFSNEGEAPPIQIGSLHDSPPLSIEIFGPSPSIPSPAPSLSTTPSPASSSMSAGTIVLGIAGILVFLLVVIFCCWCKYCRPRNRGAPITVQSGVFQVKELKMADLPSDLVQSPVPDGPPLRIFISHTRGEHGIDKNFAKSLGEKLEANPCYRVFIDCEMRKGIYFPEEILQEIQTTELAIVVVTRDYFGRPWPMLELVEFLKLYNMNRQAQTLRVLPLFYMLTPAEVKELLDGEYWQNAWTQMSIDSRRHNFIDVKTYKETVAALCSLNGVEYNYRNRDHELEYSKTILEVVKKIHIDMRKKSQRGSAQV